MLLNHYDRIKCLGDNDLPLFGFASVEKAQLIHPFSKVHEVQTIYQVPYYKMLNNIGANDRI